MSHFHKDEEYKDELDKKIRELHAELEYLDSYASLAEYRIKYEDTKDELNALIREKNGIR